MDKLSLRLKYTKARTIAQGQQKVAAEQAVGPYYVDLLAQLHLLLVICVHLVVDVPSAQRNSVEECHQLDDLSRNLRLTEADAAAYGRYLLS